MLLNIVQYTGCPAPPRKERSGPKWQKGQVEKPCLTVIICRFPDVTASAPPLAASWFRGHARHCLPSEPSRLPFPLPGTFFPGPHPRHQPQTLCHYSSSYFPSPALVPVCGSPFISAIVPYDPLSHWPVSFLETGISAVSLTAITRAPRPVPGPQLSVSLLKSGDKK